MWLLYSGQAYPLMNESVKCYGIQYCSYIHKTILETLFTFKKKTPVKTGRYTVSSIKNEGERSGGKRWGKGEKWKVMQFF